MIYSIKNYSSEVLDTSLNYNENHFRDFLKNPFQTLIIDLSKATLLEAIESLINIKKKLSPYYGKHYSCLKHHLNNIQTEFKCTLMPSHITDVFWYNFIPYLISKGLSLSTIKTICSQLKTAVQWAGKHQAIISDSYDVIKIPNYCHEQIALTPDEISHIYHFDINSIPRRKQYLSHLQRVKDMFVLSCNLGQRYSDMVRIEKKCFDRNIFKQIQQKTGMTVYVDIDKMSIDRKTTYCILEKYEYSSPIKTDISCYDKYLKQLLKYIGHEFSESVKRETKINGYININYYPKWKLIGSHTSRRTFITNNVLKGYRTLEIMRASGHKTYSSFEKYLCYFDK